MTELFALSEDSREEMRKRHLQEMGDLAKQRDDALNAFDSGECQREATLKAVVGSSCIVCEHKFSAEDAEYAVQCAHCKARRVMMP